MNRVAVSIVKTRELLANEPDTLEKLKALDESSDTMKLDLSLFVAFQEVKSLAVAMELITLDEGITLYNILGGSSDHFNRQSLAERVVCIQHFKQLMEWKVAGAKPPRKV
jgi:hypothetical protein